MAPTVTLIPGRKKNQFNAVLEGYRFCKDGKKNGNTYFRCTAYPTGCRARITINENNELVSPTPVHNHETQVAETHVHVVKQDLKRKAATSDLPTKYLVAEAAGRLDEETRQKLNCDLNAMYKMARSSRAAANTHPANPTSLENLSLPAPYTTSSSGEPMLLWDSGWSEELRRSFLFGTPHNTSVLLEAEHFVIDGTFKTAPQLMTQMLSVHGLLPSSWHMPLAFGLLPGKTQVLYTNLLEELDSFGPYDPQSILCDYELGLHNAILSVWPSSTIRGCQFHFKQAMWRALQRTDLVPEYSVLTSPIRKFFKILGAFPFLPIDDIDRAWRFVKPLIPSDMEPFVEYYERTWIGSSSRQPLFEHSKWNHHEDILLNLPRSSNLVEGWHHGFHTMMGCSHPTIWKFLDVLKKEQNLTDVKVAQHLSRQQPPKRAKKWTDYDERLRRIISDYDSYDLLDFLKAVGNAI